MTGKHKVLWDHIEEYLNLACDIQEGLFCEILSPKVKRQVGVYLCFGTLSPLCLCIKEVCELKVFENLEK